MNMLGAEVPFARLCNIEEIAYDNGVTKLRMSPGEEHKNNHGGVHGGAICTLLDIAMATAARLQAKCAVMTVDMQVAFISAGRGILWAEGRVVRLGGTIIFAEAEVRTQEGDLVARSTGVFRVVRSK
jgi:uncharacterized protein (TIGR00369 family)